MVDRRPVDVRAERTVAVRVARAHLPGGGLSVTEHIMEEGSGAR